jgi:hypothetical protein
MKKAVVPKRQWAGGGAATRESDVGPDQPLSAASQPGFDPPPQVRAVRGLEGRLPGLKPPEQFRLLRLEFVRRDSARIPQLGELLDLVKRVRGGRPRQFLPNRHQRRCSILFHFEVPGGKWQTET